MGRLRRVHFGLIAADGGGSDFNLRGSSKLPSLQASKLPYLKRDWAVMVR